MNPDTTRTAFHSLPWDGKGDALASAQLESLWEAPIGIAFLDEGLRYLRINKTLAAINGLPPEAHIGKPIREVLPALPSTVEESLQQVLTTGLPIVNALVTGRPGPQLGETHHFLANYYPMRDDAGAIIGLGATVHDITPWRRAELARDLSEARFRSLVLATAQVVWTTDAQGQVMEDSPSWRDFTGQAPRQWLGWGWLEAIHPEDRTRARQGWSAAVTRLEPYMMEYRITRPDGSYTPVLARGAPVFSADGSIREWIGTLTDISASKRAQEEHERLMQQLQRAVSVRDEFLTVAAHELRTPLTTLGFRLRSLEREAQGCIGTPATDRALEQLDTIRRQVKRLTGLVDSLVDVAHLEEGRFQLEWEPVDLCALVREVADRLADEAARAGCTLEVDAACDVTGLWDRMRLEQVLVHLLANALKYGAGRPVSIRVSQAEERARLTVRDEGIGIAPEHLPRLFGRFARGVSERNYGGLGLGLYISRRLIEALGGTISVQSTPGAGATFTVELPLRPAGEEPRP